MASTTTETFSNHARNASDTSTDCSDNGSFSDTSGSSPNTSFAEYGTFDDFAQAAAIFDHGNEAPKICLIFLPAEPRLNSTKLNPEAVEFVPWLDPCVQLSTLNPQAAEFVPSRTSVIEVKTPCKELNPIAPAFVPSEQRSNCTDFEVKVSAVDEQEETGAATESLNKPTTIDTANPYTGPVIVPSCLPIQSATPPQSGSEEGQPNTENLISDTIKPHENNSVVDNVSAGDHESLSGFAPHHYSFFGQPAPKNSTSPANSLFVIRGLAKAFGHYEAMSDNFMFREHIILREAKKLVDPVAVRGKLPDSSLPGNKFIEAVTGMVEKLYGDGSWASDMDHNPFEDDPIVCDDYSKESYSELDIIAANGIVAGHNIPTAQEFSQAEAELYRVILDGKNARVKARRLRYRPVSRLRHDISNALLKEPTDATNAAQCLRLMVNSSDWATQLDLDNLLGQSATELDDVLGPSINNAEKDLSFESVADTDDDPIMANGKDWSSSFNLGHITRASLTISAPAADDKDDDEGNSSSDCAIMTDDDASESSSTEDEPLTPHSSPYKRPQSTTPRRMRAQYFVEISSSSEDEDDQSASGVDFVTLASALQVIAEESDEVEDSMPSHHNLFPIEEEIEPDVEDSDTPSSPCHAAAAALLPQSPLSSTSSHIHDSFQPAASFSLPPPSPPATAIHHSIMHADTRPSFHLSPDPILPSNISRLDITAPPHTTPTLDPLPPTTHQEPFPPRTIIRNTSPTPLSCLSHPPETRIPTAPAPAPLQPPTPSLSPPPPPPPRRSKFANLQGRLRLCVSQPKTRKAKTNDNNVIVADTQGPAAAKEKPHKTLARWIMRGLGSLQPVPLAIRAGPMV